MNLDSAKITAYFREAETYYQDPEAKRISREAVAKMIEEEENFIAINKECPDLELRKLNLSRNNTDLQRGKIILDNYESGAVMRFISCLVMSNALMLNSEGKIVLANDIKENFTELVRIGEESAFGVVLRGKLRDADGFYVLKSTQIVDKKNIAKLIHELVVGHYLNQMRDSGLLNFAYTYGSIFCSPPIIDPETGIVTDWCNKYDEQKTAYVVYEDIHDAISVAEYLNLHPDPEHLSSLILQVAMASRIVNDAFSYTHYDLHRGNIMMRKGEAVFGMKEFYLTYKSKSGNICYILADHVATIIDYEWAFIDGHGAPVESVETYRRYNDRAMPLHDMLKLVSDLALYIFSSSLHKDDTKNFAHYLLKFFINSTTINDTQTFFQEQSENLYSLPAGMGGKLTLLDFINYVLKHPASSNVATKTPKPELILDVESILSYNQVFSFVVRDSKSSFFELYTDYLITGNQNLPEDFDDQVAYQDLIDQTEDLKQAIINKLNALQLIEITETNYSETDVFLGFRVFIDDILELFDYLEKIERVETVVLWAVSKNEQEAGRLDETRANLRMLRNVVVTKITHSLKSIAVSAYTIDNVTRTHDYQTLVENDPAFGWYKTAADLLTRISIRRLPVIETKTKSVQQRHSLVANDSGSLVRRTKLVEK